jgi:hypothetical protein
MPEGVVLQSAKEIPDREEYKRRFLLETNNVIDDKTSLETMLRILQNYYEEYQSAYDSWILLTQYTQYGYRVLYPNCSKR